MARLVWRVGLTCLLGALILGSRSATSVRAQPAPNDRFGICHVNLMALNVTDEMLTERYARAVEAGAGWTRYEIRWTDIESSSGFDYGRPDAIVRRDIANGLQIDAILNTTPVSYATAGYPWVESPRVGQRSFTPAQLAGLAATSSAPANLWEPIFADSTDNPAPGKAINPNNYWARYVQRTVERYMPGGTLAQAEGWPADAGINVWEIWNEPDKLLFWSGTMAEYYRLLKVAYLTVESTDPDATVMLGGLAHWDDQNWFPQFLSTMAADSNAALRDTYNQYFDAAAWHWYSDPRNLYSWTQQMRAYMENYGLDDKAIWVNESGVPVWDEVPTLRDDPQFRRYRATAQEQAAWVFQGFAEGLAANVERIFFFQLYDDCGNGPDAWDWYGLIRNPAGTIGEKACGPHPDQPGEPRPAYAAYQVAADVFRDTASFWRSHNYGTGLGRVALFRPPDERLLVVWNWSFEQRDFDIVATGTSGELIDVAGARQTVTPTGGVYRLPLPAATNANGDGAGAMIGGMPYILIEADTLAPSVQVAPLPAISTPGFDVTWDVQDWGTGLVRYEVLYSDGAPASADDWQVWIDGDVDPVLGREAGSAAFPAEMLTSGHTYYFTARAQDRAGNWSAPGVSQTYTTIAEGGSVSGRVFNNRQMPLESAVVEVVVDSNVVGTATTAVDGTFQVDDVPPAASYGVRARAEGYGQWPTLWSTMPEATTTLSVDLDVPPYRNQVVNGGFEAGGLAGWAATGETPPIRSTYLQRTGDGSALLGLASEGTAPRLSVLSQAVDVPNEAPGLGFWFRVYRPVGDGGSVAPNAFEVVLTPTGGGESQVLGQWGLSATADWQYAPFDLADFAGQSVELAFRLEQPSADLVTVVYVDHVALGQSTPSEIEYSHILLPLVTR